MGRSAPLIVRILLGGGLLIRVCLRQMKLPLTHFARNRLVQTE
jgi:hypothetical protein